MPWSPGEGGGQRPQSGRSILSAFWAEVLGSGPGLGVASVHAEGGRAQARQVR